MESIRSGRIVAAGADKPTTTKGCFQSRFLVELGRMKSGVGVKKGTKKSDDPEQASKKRVVGRGKKLGPSLRAWGVDGGEENLQRGEKS